MDERDVGHEQVYESARQWMAHLPSGGTCSCRMTVAQLKAALHEIQSVYEAVKRAGNAEGACEWLLDNRYLLVREGVEALQALKSADRLPCDAAGVPRYLSLCRRLVEDGQGMVDEARLLAFLRGVQAAKALRENELWLTVPVLKTALLLYAATVCRALLSAPERQQADVMRQIVSTLRWLSTADLRETLQHESVVEKLLLQDPSDIYALMDENSRTDYRARVVALARKRRCTEQQAAESALQAACDLHCHIGAVLFDEATARRRSKRHGWLYFGGMGALMIGVTALAVCLSRSWWLLLALPPLADIAKQVMDALTIKLVPPRHIPKLACENGIPMQGKTLCVISALYGDGKRAQQAIAQLEKYHLSNRDAGQHLGFGLLLDLPDAKSKHRDGDKAVLKAARQGIDALNQRYGGGFALFTRERVRGVDGYIGHERKRGALMALCRLLRGKPSALLVQGDEAIAQGVRFLITLDSDTRLSIGAAKAMVGAMLHPLNAPVVKDGVVVAGHGLLQPRIGVDLTSANASPFAQLFGGQGGFDPYNGFASDVYQDLFGQATFTGKGILDIDAMLACLDKRLPDNRVLSHDLLEGAYLRAGLLGDVELCDGVPTRALNWFGRLHRWIRGDWQIAAWMGHRVPTPKGRAPNRLNALNRWKIFDNLRRSVDCLFQLALLTATVVCRGRVQWVCGGVLALAVLMPFFTQLPGLLHRARLQHPKAFGATRGGVFLDGCKALLLTALLPYRTWVAFSAVVTALWRVMVSKRRLLQWVTAAEADAARSPRWHTAQLKMWLNAIWGIGLLCVAPSWGCLAVALGLWCAPTVAWALGRPYVQQAALSLEDHAFLVRQATLMWRYFEENLTAEHHYLPPDNDQEQPAVGLAARTSPTNIGLALLCALAAVDLQLTTKEQALTLLDRILTTVESLDKWRGHIYNWYDTRTLQPLRPCLVSTVDSGNFIGYLLTLQQGLLEWQDAAADKLAARAAALAEAMELKPLYDKERKLFAIGCDPESGVPTDGCYDLLTSEARQTSYIAIARGEVERKHWRRLSRALVEQDGYRGMASWTGTMFEYLMPHLLLPRYDNSLIDESCRFAVYVQRQHGRKHGVPWGVSESCFYAFDAALNYQYKAHGVQKLAFKREMDKELVIAPYASFLALQVEPKQAVENLRTLCGKGFEGQYGLVEAIDYTPSRQHNGHNGEQVRCTMSHHLGMSLLAIANVLHGNLFVERFLRDPRMAAYTELLEEKAPYGAPIVKAASPDVPEKPQRAQGNEFRAVGDTVDAEQPRLMLLSNGSYTMTVTDAGHMASSCNGIQLARANHGMFWGLLLNGELHSLTFAPDYDQTLRTWEFQGGQAIWKTTVSDLQVSLMSHVIGNENAERHSLTLQSGQAGFNGELVCYFEPVLAKSQDFEAHPTFSKLFLQSELSDGVLTFARRPRGDRGRHYLSVTTDTAASYDTSREQSLGRGGFEALDAALNQPPKHSVGSVLDPCLLLRVPLEVQPNEARTVTVALSYATRRADAKAAALRALRAESSSGGRIDGAMRLMAMSQAEAAHALELGAAVLYAPSDGVADKLNRLGQKDLWKFGISGDLPIVVAHAYDEQQQEKLHKLIKAQRFLAFNGLKYDLILLTRDGSDYHRPVRGQVMDALKALDAEHALGVTGGVHIFDRSVLRDEELTLLRAVARVEIEDTFQPPVRSATVRASQPRKALPSAALTVETPANGVVSFDTTHALPAQSWSHVLANRAFGAIVCDFGPGHVWRRNARENQLTPWRNDLLATQSEERIEVELDGELVSLFSAADGWHCRVTYGPGYARYVKRKGDVTLTTTIFVPCRTMARVLMLEIQGRSQAELHYKARLRMGSHAAMERHVTVDFQSETGVITARNHYNTDFAPQTVVVACSSPFDACNQSNPVTARAVLAGENGIQAVLCFGASQNELGQRNILSLLEWDAACEALQQTEARLRALTCPRKVASGEAALDNYLNGWALYQVLVCRLFARTSMYQCGGAYGFRDQLQDVCALLHSAPDLTRNQLLRAAAHQFEEGDVQHWWHEGNRAHGEAHSGVRTRCSDDLLWLPYVAALYTAKTGDTNVLAQAVPYLSSPILNEEEHERYERPRVSPLRESLLIHCKRAIDLVLSRGAGEHGLLLIGSGDWNDGFNRVGEKGRGESVWLTWFAAHVLELFAELCDRVGDNTSARYRAEAETLWQAARAAWDGEWFLRGYYDNGATLGSHADDECRIDSIAQSFACMDAQGDTTKQLTALASAYRQLVDEDNQYIKLFTPPFDSGDREPGYIKGYVPGVRENGGQYTHAAVWLAMGFAKMGQRDKALALLKLLLPANHDGAVYKAEPYVIAADVYDNTEHRGRGGWSWYTGAAGWFYRVAIDLLADEK